MSESGIGAADQSLYDLLPAVFRQADAGEGYPLLALMQVFERVLAGLRAGIPTLEDAWFVETCALDRVPAIGALLGVAVPHPVRPEHRALVADVLALRRRTGLALALPRRVRGACGWYALYAEGDATPPAAWPLPPIDRAGTPMPTVPGQGPPRGVGTLRVWRLPVRHVVGATPAAGGVPGRFTFDPLGLILPLWNVAGTALPMAAAASVTALPVALGRAMLAADLDRARAQAGEHGATENSLLYGPDRGLAIRVRDEAEAWRTVPPTEIMAAALDDDEPVPPAYPALLSGPIDPAALRAGPCALIVDFGGTRAAIGIDPRPGMALAALAGMLAAALRTASILRQGDVPADALASLAIGLVDDRLAIVPTRFARAPLAFEADGDDPLALAGPGRAVEAVASAAIGTALAARLTGAPEGTVLRFSGAGRAFAIALPLAAPPTPGGSPSVGIAAAIQAALPDCFVCAAGARVVIVARPGSAPAAPEPPSDLARSLGLVPMLALDPETGTFAWPPSWPAFALRVDYGYAAACDRGGGSYPRPAGSAIAAPVPTDATSIVAADEPDGLDAALLARDPAVAATLIRLDGAGTRRLSATGIAIAAGRSLAVVTEDAARACIVAENPVIMLAGSAPDGAAAQLVLDGLLIAASLAPAGGNLDLALHDVSLVPPMGRAAITAVPDPAATDAGTVLPDGSRPSPPPSDAVSPAPARLRLNAVRCVLGPIDLEGLSGTLDVVDGVLASLPEPSVDTVVLAAPATVAMRLVRSTLMGRVRVSGAIEAADVLFAGALVCTGMARFDHCFVTALAFPDTPAASGDPPASVTRCSTCGRPRAVRLQACYVPRLFLDPTRFCSCTTPQDGPARDCTACRDPACATDCPLRAADQSVVPIGRGPVFAADNRYPCAGFARLSDDNPPEIRAGAADRNEIGAGNRAAATARGRDLASALGEALLFGTSLSVVFES